MGAEILNKNLCEMEDLKYYIVRFVIHNKDYYTIWFTSDEDGFISDENNLNLVNFETVDAVKLFAKHNNIVLVDDEVTEILCDKIMEINLYSGIDCDSILTFWNIITDVASTLNKKFLGDVRNEDINDLYNKLFCGCNLPAIKGDAEDFVPSWVVEERKLLIKIINDGLNILMNALNIQV